MKLSRIMLCVCMAPNTAGRDFVVGDLHGHRGLLEAMLSRAGFDTGRDRLFAVGDLVDRGPASLETLALIEQPWFHAVLGNHELLLLNYLGFFDSRTHARRAFASGTGEWVLRAQQRQRRLLWRLAERLATLPLARHVAAAVPFNVVHGDLAPFGFSQRRLLAPAALGVHDAERAASSRANLADVPRKAQALLAFREHPVRLSSRALGDLPLTYVGHSRLREVTVHNSHVYIEQGVSGERPPTLLDHREFAYWLGGVSTARQGTPGSLSERLAA